MERKTSAMSPTMSEANINWLRDDLLGNNDLCMFFEYISKGRGQISTENYQYLSDINQHLNNLYRGSIEHEAVL
jgi:hypothetical protein